MLRSRRESHHNDGITERDCLQQTSTTKSALSRRCVLGRACSLCPGISDVYLFSNRESVINLDAEVSDGAFDFCVTEQELYRP
jgi:hypothetical protein